MIKKVDEKYIESLNEREAVLSQKIKLRQQEQQQVNSLFLEHVRK